MTRKREKIVIIHDILKSVQDKGNRARPTHILYRSNLSTQMLKEYLGELLEKGFMRQVTEKRRSYYSLTSKGHKYLEDFSVIRRFMESYDLEG